MPYIILKRIRVGVGTISFCWDTVNLGVVQVPTQDTIVPTSIGYKFAPICDIHENKRDVDTTNILVPTLEYIRATNEYIQGKCEIPTTWVEWRTVNMEPNTWPAFDGSDISRTEDFTAESCGFVPDDIKILSITQADSGADKLITINASSSNGGLTYSLDGTTYQASNQFTITESGVYIAYVKDANDKTAQEAFEVALDTYGVRWSGEFDDDKENRYSVSIEELNYSGAVETLSFSGSPAIISYPTDSDVYKPIRGSELVLGLVSEIDYQFVDLFTAIDKKFRAKVSIGGAVVWQGFVSPEAYMEPFTCVPYDVSLSFVDGLGVLKRRSFEAPNGEAINTLRSDLDLISFCLRQTGLELPLYTTLNIHEIQMEDLDSDPLSQTFVNTRYLTGKSIYEVLESVLQKWGACVYFEDNAWFIRNVDEIGRGSYTRRLYNYGGEYSSSDTYNPDVSITSWDAATRRAWVNADMQLEMLPALKEVKLTVNADTDTNIIPNGDFQQVDESGNIKFWTDDSGIVEKKIVIEDGKQKEVIRLIGDYGTYLDSISSNEILLQVDQSLIKFIFKIRFKVNGPSTVLASEVLLRLRFDGDYYLFSDGTWRTTDEATNTLGISAPIGEWIEFTMETTTLPGSSSYLQVFILQGQSLTAGEEIDSVDIEYVKLDYIEEGVKIESSKTYTSTSGEKYLAKESRNISFGDFQEYDNPGLVIKNTLFVNDGTDIVDSVSWMYPIGTRYSSEITGINTIEVTGDVTGEFSAGDQILLRQTSQGVYNVLSAAFPVTGAELTNDAEFDSGGEWYVAGGSFTAVTFSDGTAEVGSNLYTPASLVAGTSYRAHIICTSTGGGYIVNSLTKILEIPAGSFEGTVDFVANTDRIGVIPYSGSGSNMVLTFFSVKEVEDKTLITIEEETLINGACTVEIFPGYMSLIQLLAERILNQRSRPIYKLSGTINGVLKFSNLVSDSNLAGKKFMITGYERDLRTRDHRVELVELQDTTDILPYILREDGSYLLREDGDYFLMEDT